MSRALNVAVDKADVMESCAKRGITISAIEALLSGGTRVVLMNADDAAVIARLYKSKIIPGAVTRTRWVRNS